MSTKLRWADLGQTFDGPHATPTRRAEGPYFLNITSLRSGRLDLAASDHVAPEDFAKWTKRVTPRAGDLLFSYETRLGEAALMPEGVEACLGRRMALLRPDLGVVDPQFLLYFYLSPQFQRTIAERTIHGATVPRILLSDMPNWQVEIPPLEKQRAIAEVLGALDDKIAANMRLVKTFDDLAGALFARAITEAEVERTALGDVATLVLGGTPSRGRAELWEGGTIPWLNSGKANQPRVLEPSEFITEEAVQVSATKMMPKGTTIVAITGATLGKVSRLEIEACGNQSLVGVWADNPMLTDWLHYAIRNHVTDLLRHATGAAQQHVNKKDVQGLVVPVLPSSDLAEWSAGVSPLLERAGAADRENIVLAQTRDALLPLLMSGRVTVKDAELVVEGVA